MAKYRYNRTNKGKAILLIVLITLVLVVVGGGLAAHRVYTSNLKPLSSTETSVIFEVETGETAQQIADKLEESKVIRKSWAFQWYVRNNNLRDKLQAGTYALKPSQSVQEIANILTQGKVDTQSVTILPGKRVDQIRDGLINDGFDKAEVDAALDPAIYAGHPALVDKPADANLEGYLYPETFERTLNTKPETVIRQSLDQMAKHLTPELRAGIVAQGLTVHQGVVLASIIEQEVPNTNPVDRPQVAQVFLKRLQIGMMLQSDATSKYGAVLDGVDTDQAYDSLYNTYSHYGLTPTPISNVSVSSLQAVAKPSGTDYLYFVTGNDCVNRFSATNPQHEQAKAQHGIGCKK